MMRYIYNKLRPEDNGTHFATITFNFIFKNGNIFIDWLIALIYEVISDQVHNNNISRDILLKCFPDGTNDIKSAYA